MKFADRIHRSAVPTETAREYSLVVDLQVARQRMAEDEDTIARLRQEAAVQRDSAKQLHREVADLKLQVLQLEIDRARWFASTDSEAQDSDEDDDATAAPAEVSTEILL